jgi:hypothetical protein
MRTLQCRMESSADIGLYTCVHIIPRGKKKKKRGGGGRGKKGIYIYKIYGVDPFLSAGVVAMRQLALLYTLVHSLHALIRARTHIYTSVFSHEGTYTSARAHPRENVYTHAHDAYEHKVHACIRTQYMHAYTRTMLMHVYLRLRANTPAHAPTLV